MSDRQETTVDIIAWLRRPREGENAYLTLWRDEIANRLEAAHRRERGDCAKLREALEKVRHLMPYFLQYMRLRWEDAGGGGYYESINKTIDAALSAPPRNCDRPKCETTKAAQDVWRREDGGKTAYYEWLLATANVTVSIMGRESINKQCWECANCKEPTAGWDGSKFRCAFLAKDFGTWHYDVPNECPCKGKGWMPKKQEGGNDAD